jgi:hypothetical protein
MFLKKREQSVLQYRCMSQSSSFDKNSILFRKDDSDMEQSTLNAIVKEFSAMSPANQREVFVTLLVNYDETIAREYGRDSAERDMIFILSSIKVRNGV